MHSVIFLIELFELEETFKGYLGQPLCNRQESLGLRVPLNFTEGCFCCLASCCSASPSNLLSGGREALPAVW